MLNHHIDLVPGQSFLIGNLRVTLVRVEGENVAFKFDDDFGPETCSSMDSDGTSINYEPELALV